jgi:hypothetical protein
MIQSSTVFINISDSGPGGGSGSGGTNRPVANLNTTEVLGNKKVWMYYSGHHDPIFATGHQWDLATNAEEKCCGFIENIDSDGHTSPYYSGPIYSGILTLQNSTHALDHRDFLKIYQPTTANFFKVKIEDFIKKQCGDIWGMKFPDDQWVLEVDTAKKKKQPKPTI